MRIATRARSLILLTRLLVFVGLLTFFLPSASLNTPVYAQGECSPLDVALLIDSTGSMGGAIANVKAEAVALIDQIVTASGGNYQLGLIEFRDNIVVLSDMAPGTASAVKGQIAGLIAAGGEGGPEASDEALNTVINHLGAAGRPQVGNFTGTWRSDATKIIILITDAPPAGFDDTYTVGIDNANANQRAAEARDAGIFISAVYVPTAEDLVAAEAAGINAINNEYADIAEAIMLNYQRVTDGGFIKTARDGSGTAAAIRLTIEKCGPIGAVTPQPVKPPVQVPEPITVTLLGTGLASLAGYVWRKRQTGKP